MPEITKQKTSKQDSQPADCPYPDCPYKRKVALLEYELKEMRERYWGRKKKKLSEESEELVSARKRGAPKGHPGWFRKVGAKIDEFVDVTLNRCPKCGGKKLTRCKDVEEHIQEDIILPKLKATCFRHYSYWCEDCKEIVEPERPAGELPKSYIGPTAKALAVWLKYDIKISDRDLKRLFETLFNLKIVPASVAGFRNQLARYSINIYQQIQQALKRSTYVHSDETGWKVGNDNQWLWSLSNRRFSLFHVDKSRGLKVLQSLLGERFNGTLIVDFLRVYNKYKAKSIQRCFVHLQREIKKMLEVWGEDSTIRRYLENLKDWIEKARELGKRYRRREISKSYLQRQKANLWARLNDFEITTVQKKPLLRIRNRLLMHRQELLTFLDHPQVDSDNNHAERQIRPNVLLRKITFGNNSTVGAQNHGIFMSIIQTAKQNSRSPPDILMRILLARGKVRVPIM
jgi:hypothetical protein